MIADGMLLMFDRIRLIRDLMFVDLGPDSQDVE